MSHTERRTKSEDELDECNAIVRRYEGSLGWWDVILILLAIGSAVYLLLLRGFNGVLELAVSSVFLATVVSLILKFIQRQTKLEKFLKMKD